MTPTWLGQQPQGVTTQDTPQRNKQMEIQEETLGRNMMD